MGNEWAGYLTVRQAATKLGLSRARVYDLLRRDRIPFKLRGDIHYMIKLADLEQFAAIPRPVGRPRPSPFE
jgi:excisionase family DNA binding protein